MTNTHTILKRSSCIALMLALLLSFLPLHAFAAGEEVSVSVAELDFGETGVLPLKVASTDYVANITAIAVNGEAWTKNDYKMALTGKQYYLDTQNSKLYLNNDGRTVTLLTNDAIVITNPTDGDLTVKLTNINGKLGVEVVTPVVDDSVYVLMNIPYAAFYQAEGYEIDALSAATPNKATNDTLAANSYYDGAAEAVSILGVSYPVKVSAAVLNDGGYTAVADAATLRSAGDYAYTTLTGEPTSYKELTVKDSAVSFDAATGTKTQANASVALSTGGDGHHPYYYQMSVSGVDVDGKVCAVTVKTNETQNNVYGLRHVCEIWRSTELGLEAGHALEGKTVTEITYYLNDGTIYTIPVNLYIPLNTKAAELTVSDAPISAKKTTGTIANLPNDFDAAYAVTKDGKAVSDIQVSVDADGNISLSWTGTIAHGTYTLAASDQKGIYAPVTADFVLRTETVYAAYDNSGKKLVAASGISSEDFAAYLQAISSVTVDDKSYAASGRRKVTIITADGSLTTDTANVDFSQGTHEVIVKATGYPDLTFTVTNSSTETPDPTKPTDPTTPTTPASRFIDVPADEWYADAVNTAADKGLMVGVGGNKFEPAGIVSRSQIARIVWNLADQPAVSGKAPFTDVEANSWYTQAVVWAYQNNVVFGTSRTTFAPAQAVTRQDFTCMLYRYAGSPKTTADLSKFTDAGAVADYAQDAVQWAVAKGILVGNDYSQLRPRGSLTRAEAATIMVRHAG